jgi:hypothetical protein
MKSVKVATKSLREIRLALFELKELLPCFEIGPRNVVGRVAIESLKSVPSLAEDADHGLFQIEKLLRLGELAQEKNGSRIGKQRQIESIERQRAANKSFLTEKYRLPRESLEAFRKQNPNATVPEAAEHLFSLNRVTSQQSGEIWLRRLVSNRVIPKFEPGKRGFPLGGVRKSKHR